MLNNKVKSLTRKIAEQECDNSSDGDKLEFFRDDLDGTLDDLIFQSRKCQKLKLEEEQLEVLHLLLEHGNLTRFDI